jgi:HPt (histidine-containing phosphotransfer) domain-containing protein
MSPSLSAPVLDRKQLRQVTLDDENLMREILETLIDDTSLQIGRLNRAIASADSAECVRVAHYAKGACASAGAISAAALLRRIEGVAAQGDFSACRASLGELEKELNKLRTAAKDL